MIRIRLTLDIGRRRPEQKPLPGEGGAGGAQVELADETPGLRVGFNRPEDGEN